MASELIELMTDRPAGSFDLHIAGEELQFVMAGLAHVEQLRREAARSQAAAAVELRDVARHLHDRGIPLRDIGQLVGVSYQRAHQLVNS